MNTCQWHMGGGWEACLLFPFLVYILYFERIKGALRYHLEVCVCIHLCV
jgi:hypothetical protein